MAEALTASALATLFTDARTHNGWLEKSVSDEQLKTGLNTGDQHANSHA